MDWLKEITEGFADTAKEAYYDEFPEEWTPPLAPIQEEKPRGTTPGAPVQTSGDDNMNLVVLGVGLFVFYKVFFGK